jgi:hypothetical protein
MYALRGKATNQQTELEQLQCQIKFDCVSSFHLFRLI